VAGADPVLLELLSLAEALRAGRDDEAGVTAGLELGVDGGDDDVDVGDAAVGDPGLGPVEHPFVGGVVVHGAGAQVGDVAAGVGFAHRERAHLELLGGPEALGDPFGDLLGGAVPDDPRHREGGPEDRQGDAGVAPAHLLADHREGDAGRVTEGVGDELPGVQADVGGLLDDRPGGLFALVPLVGRGPDDVLREVVDPFLDLELVLVELEGEVRHGCLLGRSGPPDPTSY
jgi:hypothetical protein